ncbi:hypothetical protein SSS_08194, partial [Sarcoptes scabiei]
KSNEMLKCNQINRFWANSVRYFSTSSFSCTKFEKSKNVPLFAAIELKNKALVRVSGPGSFIYLQSLLTNDLRKLLNPIESPENVQNECQYSIYSYLLSAVGRVLCDMFIYRGRFLVDGDYIIEVDKYLANSLKRLLLGYNLKRDISVDFADEFKLWSVIPYSMIENSGQIQEVNDNDSIEQLQTFDSDDIKLVADPRVGSKFFGYRLLTRLGGLRIQDIGSIIKCQSKNKKIKLMELSVGDYNRLKYQLGLAEGHNDILSGFYYPFELNGDYINAISLNKGLINN